MTQPTFRCVPERTDKHNNLPVVMQPAQLVINCLSLNDNHICHTTFKHTSVGVRPSDCATDTRWTWLVDIGASTRLSLSGTAAVSVDCRALLSVSATCSPEQCHNDSRVPQPCEGIVC